MAKRALVCVVFLLFARSLEAAMSRVVEVRNTRTIVVDNGREVRLDVVVAPQDEAEALRYLKTLLAGRWVYIENGRVYRSPDALYVNDALKRRAWTGYTFLGELNPPPVGETRAEPKKPARTPPKKKR